MMYVHLRAAMGGIYTKTVGDFFVEQHTSEAMGTKTEKAFVSLVNLLCEAGVLSPSAVVEAVKSLPGSYDSDVLDINQSPTYLKVME